MQKRQSQITSNGYRPKNELGFVKKCVPVVCLLVICSLFGSACNKNPVESDEFVSFEWPVSSPEEQGFDPEMFSRALEEAKNRTFIFSLVVVRHGYLVSEYYRWTDYYNRNDPWMVRSMTKSFISALIGIAIEHGYIDSVGQHVLDFFPEYVTPSLDPRKQDMTIEDLLTMKSGLPSDGSADTLLSGQYDFIKDILECPLIDDPGEDFHYSSIGAHLLSGILTKASGMNTRDFADQYLCEPLGISIPYWDADPQGYPYGGSGMRLMPRDMARFGLLYLQNGSIDGRRILSEAWIRASFQDYEGGDWTWGVLEHVGYGYLWWMADMGDYRIFFALGWSGQYILVIPDLDMVIVTTSNFPFEPEESDLRERSILELVKTYILPAVRFDEGHGVR